MVYFATAQESEPTALFEGHEYEGSPGRYLHTPVTDEPMECSIFMMGLLLEIVNAGHPFEGLMIIYQNDMENPEPDEFLAFKLNLSKTTQFEFHTPPLTNG